MGAPITQEELEENEQLGIQFARHLSEEGEVAQYQTAIKLASIANPLEWWAANALFPRLAHFAKKYLCVPASTVPSERAFSSASNIDTRHRHHMDPETLELCVLIHHYFCESRRKPLDFRTIPEVNL